MRRFHKILRPSFSSTDLRTCSYHLVLHSKWNFSIVTNGFSFVLFFRQIKAGVNDMCDTFTILVAKLATWSFTSFINTIPHRISFNSLLLCSTKKTFSLSFQLSFPGPLPLFTFIVAFCFSHKLLI